ncbi:Septin-7 [Geodia barretti]|uniref:Septin n=1 Tax=Geodia barretti TaxID=519541 RepID=A0AA35RR37_GEOBA|nr:Septin-7 [Geodia barretti]
MQFLKKWTVKESEKAAPQFVGYANLPNQVFRKAVKRGFDFTLMVVGQSGLGKSTLINSLFMSDIYEDSTYNGSGIRMPKTTQIRSSTVHVQEGGVHLELTVIDTPGFGDVVDNSQCWKPITEHVNSLFEEFLNAESRVIREAMEDRRVHVCLYFIAPTGHGLKQVDIEFMKELCEKVNVIPVIAKADTLTPEECSRFKKTIMNEIHENGIKIYQFPDSEGDEEEAAANKKLRDAIPFAVVGSNTVVEVSGKKVRGRLYPWGVAEVDNLSHCDFTTLRNMLVRTHMQDLKDVTDNVHYENYRCQKLAGFSGSLTPRQNTDPPPSRDPMAQFDVEKREHEMKMKKMEQEMEEVFEMKVQEKLQKLRDIEADLNRRKEQMSLALKQQQQELQTKRKQFDEDKRLFEEEHQRYMKELEDSMRSKDNKKHKKK